MAVTRFDVIQPGSLEEAIRCLAGLGADAQPIAGGTDLLRDIRMGVKKPKVLVALDRIAALGGIREEASAGLSFGPLCTMAELSRDERVRRALTALWEAAAQVGSTQVRNRATLGGNLCNARPCADCAPPAIVLDGMLVLRGPAGSREVPASAFMTGPGKTVRAPDELLERIRFDKLPEKTGSAFLSVTNRKAVEITITSAAARLTLSGNTIAAAKICLGSVGPIPLPAPHAEQALVGKSPSPEVLTQAAKAAVQDATPIDDLRGTAAYRRWMVEVLVGRTLTQALERARGGVA